MRQLANNFTAAFPVFPSIPFNGSCNIEEPKNFNTNNFQRIELTGFAGFAFPHELASGTSSFASVAKHTGVMTLDCDGIVMFEKNGQKYMLFCELKSSYVKDDIVHAKDQLVGSSVKMKGLLSTLQGYNRDEYKYIGLIVSFEPTQEQLASYGKLTDRGASFVIRLNHDKRYLMPAANCNTYFHPLAVDDFNIYYVPVPNRQTTFSVDINTIIQ